MSITHNQTLMIYYGSAVVCAHEIIDAIKSGAKVEDVDIRAFESNLSNLGESLAELDAASLLPIRRDGKRYLEGTGGVESRCPLTDGKCTGTPLSDYRDEGCVDCYEAIHGDR